MDAGRPRTILRGLKTGGKKAMQRSRILMLAIPLVTGGLSLSGCATEDYVNTHIAVVNQRIDALEARVGQVEGTANQANQSAQQANQRLDQLTPRVDSIEQQLANKKPRG
jgi:murein lipoprotein